MTRDDIRALESLHVKRDKVRDKIEQLAKVKSDKIECGARMTNGGWETFFMPKAYLGAQWTAELHDVERRIRAAGGTL